MKRKSIIVLGVVCCLAGAACGSSKSTNTEVTPNVTTAPTQDLQIEIGGITNFPLPTLAPTATPEPTPTLRCITKNDEVKTEEDGVLVFRSQISYPSFEGIGAEGLNAKVSELVESFRTDMELQEKGAKSDYADSKKYGSVFETEEDDFFVNVSGKSDELMSLTSVRFTNAGGPHPNFYQLGYVYKIADGTQMTLDDYLKQYQVTAKDVAEYAAAEFEKRVEEEGDEFLLTKTLSEEVLDLINANHWYFSDNGVVVFINPYEIAPYALGSFMSVIPFEVLKQGLKNN